MVRNRHRDERFVGDGGRRKSKNFLFLISRNSDSDLGHQVPNA